jgi:hypothetical protein
LAYPIGVIVPPNARTDSEIQFDRYRKGTVATAATLKKVFFLVIIVAAVCAPASQAGLISGLTNIVVPTCGATSQPFAQFGDYNSYFPVPNHGLESGTTGWSLGTGAYVGAGNEPWYVGGYGSRSLVLRPGASASSPPSCISLLDPYVRAFAKSNSATGPLRMQVIFYGLTGNLLGLLNVDDQAAADFTEWQPTSNVPSLLGAPLLTTYFRVKFTSLASNGTWQVDDLYVDPWASRG